MYTPVHWIRSIISTNTNHHKLRSALPGLFISNPYSSYLSASAFVHTSEVETKQFIPLNITWLLLIKPKVASLTHSHCSVYPHVRPQCLSSWLKKKFNLCNTIWAGQDLHNLWTNTFFPLLFIYLLHSWDEQFYFFTSSPSSTKSTLADSKAEPLSLIPVNQTSPFNYPWPAVKSFST